MNKVNERLPWIDWAKAIGMYFIVAGHCFGPGHKFIYTFSVPLFFIVSGFLNKTECDFKVFLKKIFYNLLLPLLIFLSIYILSLTLRHVNSGTFHYLYPLGGMLNGIIGRQGQNFVSGGLGTMWFVYTLVLCKILIQIIPKVHRNFTVLLINLFFLICLHFWGEYFKVYNCYVNVLLAFPFFSIGYYLQSYKYILMSLKRSYLFLLILCGIVGIILSANNNGIVYLYTCSYGGNLLMCFIGAIAGTIVVVSASLLLGQYGSRFAQIIGGGSIVILGLHQYIISFINNLICPITGGWVYLESLIIVLLFVPIISFVKKKCPILLGRYRVI